MAMMSGCSSPYQRDERAELIEHLIDSLEDEEVELSAEELAHLDLAIADADLAVARGEL